jgi:hypothetical protein
MEKQLGNPEKKKKEKEKQPRRPSSAKPGRAPAPPDRWATPVSGSFCPRALAPSLPPSLPHLISRSPAPARALPTPSDLAGDPRPPPWSSSLSKAAPSAPELCPEVRHPFPCSVSLITLCRRPISASLEFGRGGPPHPRGDRPN